MPVSLFLREFMICNLKSFDLIRPVWFEKHY